jgi:ABC-type glutathione transport system ATPase component
LADAALLEVSQVETCYGLSQVLFGMSLAVAPGEMVTLMGRNGMGKTTTVRSIMGLTPATAGAIRFAGDDVLKLGGGALRRYRERVVTIFQDPRAHVNPVRRIGDFMTEGLRLHDVPRDAAARRAVEALERCGTAAAAEALVAARRAATGMGVLWVTHDAAQARRVARRWLLVRDGSLEEALVPPCHTSG